MGFRRIGKYDVRKANPVDLTAFRAADGDEPAANVPVVVDFLDRERLSGDERVPRKAAVFGKRLSKRPKPLLVSGRIYEDLLDELVDIRFPFLPWHPAASVLLRSQFLLDPLREEYLQKRLVGNISLVREELQLREHHRG